MLTGFIEVKYYLHVLAGTEKEHDVLNEIGIQKNEAWSNLGCAWLSLLQCRWAKAWTALIFRQLGAKPSLQIRAIFFIGDWLGAYCTWALRQHWAFSFCPVFWARLRRTRLLITGMLHCGAFAIYLGPFFSALWLETLLQAIGFIMKRFARSFRIFAVIDLANFCLESSLRDIQWWLMLFLSVAVRLSSIVWLHHVRSLKPLLFLNTFIRLGVIAAPYRNLGVGTTEYSSWIYAALYCVRYDWQKV